MLGGAHGSFLLLLLEVETLLRAGKPKSEPIKTVKPAHPMEVGGVGTQMQPDCPCCSHCADSLTCLTS